MDLDLRTLKRSISEELDRSGFAVFRYESGSFEPQNVVTWDVETYPDYRMFFDAARKLGVKLMLFASTEFDDAEIEDLTDQLDFTEMPPSLKRESENHLKEARRHIGDVSSIELAFTYENWTYLYVARPDWYEEFESVREDIEAMTSAGLTGGEDDDEEDENEDGIGGFYSKN